MKTQFKAEDFKKVRNIRVVVWYCTKQRLRYLLPVQEMAMQRKRRVDWHKAITAAIKINLQEYQSVLEYSSEYVLGESRQRIDLLVVKRNCDKYIPINFARCFRKLNVFEFKGAYDTLTTDSYYKSIGYVCQLIVLRGKKDEYTAKDTTLTLVSMKYPGKLMTHLKERERNNGYPIINRKQPGIYFVAGETFTTQILVLKEISEQENKYLRCLYERQENAKLLGEVIQEYETYKNREEYEEYMQQLLTAVTERKERTQPMCEAIFTLFGTSSEEIAEKATMQLREQFREQYKDLETKNQSLIEENVRLKNLLVKHNIQEA